MSKKETVVFTKQQAKDFIIAYNKAVKEGARVFQFEGHDVLTSYANYVIQWFVMEKFVAGTFDNNKKFTQHDK